MAGRRVSTAVDLQEGRVARAPVVHHDFLDALAGGQRAGREQERIAGLGGGAMRAGHAGLLFGQRKLLAHPALSI